MSQVTFSKSSVGTNDRCLHPHSSIVVILGNECAVIPDWVRCLSKSSENLENFLWMIRLYPDCDEIVSLEACLTRISLPSCKRLRNVSARWWHGRVSLPIEKKMGMSVKNSSLLHPAQSNTLSRSCRNPSEVYSLVSIHVSDVGCVGLLYKVITPICLCLSCIYKDFFFLDMRILRILLG